MALLDLEYPPVLTPRTIARLNGRLEANVRESLTELLREAIHSCFKPFAAYRGRRWPEALHRFIEQYVVHRLLILRRFLEALGPQALRDACRLLKEYVDTLDAEAWARIGADARRVRSVFKSYFRTLSRLLKDLSRLNAWPSPPGPVFLRLMGSAFNAATELDFCLTALVLAVEGELSLRKPAVSVLLETARRSAKQLYVDVDALCRRPSRLEEYFVQLLMEQGLFVPPSEDRNRPEASRDFKPVEVRGEPVSHTILRERR